jgi:putative addiction module killer protein
MIELVHYTKSNGQDVFGTWLEQLRDKRAQAVIAVRLDRLANGNSGDCKALGMGLNELRIHYGPGFRVYFGKAGQHCVILLCGGDKSSQASDIAKAREYFEDYMKRIKQQ